MVKAWMNGKLAILFSSFDEMLLSVMVHLWWQFLCEIYGYMYECVYCEYAFKALYVR